MNKSLFFLMILSCLLISLTGCATKGNNAGITSEISSENPQYTEQIEAARKYIIKNNWGTQNSVKTNTAVVSNHTVDSLDEVLSKKYVGKIVYKVSFEDEPNTVTGLPVVLIDKDSNNVIGYIPSE
ncbi:hypothetical protein [Sporosarcina limicola]|uniref:PepSY domain-containing protein n=1 Tax=Sporosarcina limicola TaxID=34101 RepID=A0A927R4T2_9BACL|nr:hypothetical protein [Sporosarcina limicola]MBE1556561.1 hypothetical protein [Sporosarcina limicola]